MSLSVEKFSAERLHIIAESFRLSVSTRSLWPWNITGYSVYGMRSECRPKPYAGMPFQRKNFASVPPVVIAGTTVLSGIIRLLTRRIAAMSGVSVGDTLPPRLRSDGVSIVTLDASGPSASLIIASTSCCSTPGSERMSTSMSTRSGITFTFVPPCAMLGENVVWVHACASRASARLSRSHTASYTRSGSVSASVRPGSSVQRLHVAAPGIEDARLRPVLGEPLHDLGGGHERVVGLERPRAVAGRAVDDQAAPVAALLADRHLQGVAGLGRDRHAAALGDDVVALHGVRVMLDQVAGAQKATRLLVGDRQIDERAARAPAALGEPIRGHGHRGRQVQHVDGAAAPHDAVRPARPRTDHAASPTDSPAPRRCDPSAASVGALGSRPSIRVMRLIRPGSEV